MELAGLAILSEAWRISAQIANRVSALWIA